MVGLRARTHAKINCEFIRHLEWVAATEMAVPIGVWPIGFEWWRTRFKATGWTHVEIQPLLNIKTYNDNAQRGSISCHSVQEVSAFFSEGREYALANDLSYFVFMFIIHIWLWPTVSRRGMQILNYYLSFSPLELHFERFVSCFVCSSFLFRNCAPNDKRTTSTSRCNSHRMHKTWYRDHGCKVRNMLFIWPLHSQTAI